MPSWTRDGHVASRRRPTVDDRAPDKRFEPWAFETWAFETRTCDRLMAGHGRRFRASGPDGPMAERAI